MRVQTLNTETIQGRYEDHVAGKYFRLQMGEHTSIDIEDCGGGVLRVRTIEGRLVIKPEVSNAVEVSVE